MMKISNGMAMICVAVIATSSLLALRAQDDLDDLLKELEDPKAAKAPAPAAPAPAAEAPKAKPAAPAAEAPKPKAEAPAAEAQKPKEAALAAPAAEPAPKPAAQPAPAPAAPEGSIDDLLNEVANEKAEKKAAPAAAAPAPAPAKAEPAPEPAKAAPAPVAAEPEPAPAPAKAKPAPAAAASVKSDDSKLDDIIDQIENDEKGEKKAASEPSVPAKAEPAPKPAKAAPAPAKVEPVPAPAAVAPVESDDSKDVDEILKKLEEEEKAEANRRKAAPAPAPAKAEPAPAPAPAPVAPAPAPAKAEPAPAKAEPAPAPAKDEPETAPAAGAGLPQDPVLLEIVMLERMRRESLENQARSELQEARLALQKRDFQIAFDKFNLARSHFDDGRKAELKECRDGMAEAKYELAKISKNEGDTEMAKKLAIEASRLGHPAAQDMIEALNDNSAYEDSVDRSETKQRLNEQEYKSKRDQIRKYLKSARSHMATAEYDTAMGYVEAVLSSDPYNTEAVFLREQIALRKTAVRKLEAEANRVEMMSQIDKAKRLTYAVDAPGVKSDTGTTTKRAVNADSSRSEEEEIEKRMKEIILPNVAFKPPATVSDAVDQFRQASRDYDRQDKPAEERGINFILQLGKVLTGSGNAAAAAAAPADDFAAPAAPAAEAQQDIPQIPNLTASNISLWDALKLVCEVTGFKFKVSGSIVKVMPKDYVDSELITRSYNVMDNFLDRVREAGEDIKSMGSGNKSGFDGGNDNGGNDNSNVTDARAFFAGMGVEFPPRSSIHYIKALGKLRVTNTAENLAVLEQALNDLNVTPMLIEIETRFVEVAQEDLNSLGFEWLLNSDYSLHVGKKIARALNLKEGNWITTTSGTTTSTTTGDGTSGLASTGTTTSGTTTGGASDTGTAVTSYGVWQRKAGTRRYAGISGNADGTYTTGHRFLTDLDNPISGSGNYTNDKFMRLNAFLGSADLSLILHMLSQRSDTDLLSAPKVTTKSGQQAVIKVVTEYIYPTDYDVTIQGSGGSYSNGKILAMVEPQNFTMREVGVILDVTPEVTAEGQMINLALKPEVISEPEWHNYGMKIPIDNSNSSIIPGYNGINNLLDGAANQLAALSQNNANQEQEYYDAPMEQPFFKRRAIETNLSVYNGATVVMGGLITEERKTMDDKIPFLGDIPYLGRLFRSRSEWSSKRNLLVFVTARLVDPRGREITMGTGDREEDAKDAGNVTPAPAAAAAP